MNVPTSIVQIGYRLYKTDRGCVCYSHDYRSTILGFYTESTISFAESMLHLHQRYSYQQMVPSRSLSDSKTSFLDDYEAYEQYYSTNRLPFHLPFRCKRFQLLAIAVLVFLFTLFVRRHHSGVFDFGISLEAHTPTKTLGGVLRCDPEVMKPSAKTPDDVNQVRPADINVIAAMGDSITVAYLSRNYHDDPYVLYPGNSYVTGGDETLEKHISVANILRIFNPGIIGMSHGIGYDNTVFNVAVDGKTSMDIPRQAEELIHRMKAKGVRLRDDWKLISIFIGTNDLGELRCHIKEKPISRDVYKTKLEEGIGLLRSNLNRTIVSIVSMWNPQLTIDAKSLIDEGKRVQCGDDFVTKRDALSAEYRKVAYELQDEKRFDHKDFTVVVQGFMDDIKDAFRNKSGEYDKSFYASDVFHLSKYGNAVLAKFLWNNLIEAVGRKTTQADLGNDEFPIKCPSKERPYIQTLGNKEL